MGPSPPFAPQGLPIREYLLVGLCAAVVTFLITGVIRRLAIRAGAIAVPRGRDVHTVPIPRLGGVAMYIGVLAGVFVASQLPVLRRAFDYSSETRAVMVAGGLIVLVGALDDRFGIDALTKLAGQATSAGVLVLLGVQWFVLPIPDGSDGSDWTLLILDPNQGVVLTVFLCVVLVNAVNFVDGLDGLAAGIGLIASSAILAFSLGLLEQRGGDVTAYPPALIAAVLAGACAGFLPHNFQPARIFMGDSGSMLIGLMLAAATTSASGRITYADSAPRNALALLAPIVVVAAVVLVPLLDLLLAVVRRTRAGRSPFAPDKMHLHHRLLEIGHSQRRAVLLIYLWAGVFAFGAVALALITDVFLVVGVVGAGLLIAVLASAVPRLRAR
ncbi:MAG: UDP-GlcNAc:undecaprenyl-phosphate/decaprenyl-phosphate GlcNAc-phosphate transferase [Microbacteriaceae bacterium]|nr:UDP-GlcNAc:undecaprenyl-phosphate/decaprenyl-phosphate GlcNAc-phosphate transferase [Microbacteriaceae bacterium]MDT7741429.1 UDP-GlcNAc:undecaprenyl-phosphate/decaprenyl-phosphate GlcNAc-phosphate transferase [Actinomycetota bacterium]